MKLYGAVLVATFPICAIANGSGNVISYDSLPERIRMHNGSSQSARFSALAARERNGHLRRSFLPELELQGGSETGKVGSSPDDKLGFWSASARVNLFRGGRDYLEEQARKSEAAVASAESEFNFQRELKQARHLYWQLTANRLLLDDVKEAIQNNEENLKSARRRSGAGVATAADSVRFEIERTSLNHVLKRLEHEDDVLSNKLAVKAGLGDHKNLVVAKKFPHPPEAEFQERQISTSQNLHVIQLRQAALAEKMRSRGAGRWYLPELEIYGKYGVPSLGEDYSLAARQETQLIAGVSVKLDLGRSYQDDAERSARNLAAAALNAKAEQRMREVKADGHELQHDLRLLHELLHDAEIDIKKATEYLALTRTEYKRGVKNGPDLQEAVGKLFEIKKRTIEINLEYQMAKADLEALTAPEHEE